MKFYDRIILFFFGIIMALSSVGIIVLITLLKTDAININEIYQRFDFITSTYFLPSIVCAAFIIFVLSIRLIVGIGNSSRKPVIKLISSGEVEISLETFESIVFMTLKKFPQIREFTVRVKKSNDNLNLFVRLFILPDVNIPDLIQEVQQASIEAVENSTNIKIKQIKTRIQNIYNPNLLKPKASV